MGSAGGGKVNVTDDNGTSDNHPTFSPDGSRIAFNSSRPNGAAMAVYLVGAGGGAVSRLASSQGFDHDPDWGTLDVTPPAVAKATPAEGARNLSPKSNATAVFSEAMDGDTLNGKTFSLSAKGAAKKVGAAVGYDSAGLFVFGAVFLAVGLGTGVLAAGAASLGVGSP